MELIIFIFFVFSVYFFIKNKKNKNQISVKNTQPVKSEYFKNEININSYSIEDNIPLERKITWHKKNSSLEIKQYKINEGLIYVQDTSLDYKKRDYWYDNDASVIDLSLDIKNAEPWEHAEEMGYWPSYSNISANCRGAYLKWLSTGRSEPKANIGYVFLFFYGLEKRIFVDAKAGKVSEEERNEIVKEILRLIEIYGKNNSFRNYALNFLSMHWLIFDRDKELPEYLQLDNKDLQELFNYFLAKEISSKEQLSIELALIWVSNFTSLRTPAHRCNSKFKELFKCKYKQKFGEGLKIKPNKTYLRLYYNAASPSIHSVELTKKELALCDPSVLSAPLNKLKTLADECTNALDQYSRFIGREGNSPESFSALSLLPAELITNTTIFQKLKNFFNELTSSGINVVEIKKIYEIFGEAVPSSFTKKDQESLSSAIELIHFGMAPNVNFHNIKPNKDGKIVIFEKGHGIDFKPSQEFQMMCSILRLSAIVSQIDGNVSASEEEFINNIILDNRKLTNIEKDSLKALSKWLLITPQNINGLKKKLEGTSTKEKTAIGHILISVAHADGYIDKKEITQLEKLYTLLGLDKEQVVNDLHNFATIDEPITVAYKDNDNSFNIKHSNQDMNKASFQLNNDLIKIREAETQGVKEVLHDIFSEEDEIEEKTSKSNSPLDSLDDSHKKFFIELISKDEWERKEIEEISNKLGLMINGAIEILNEWGFENADALLIDDGDIVYIDTELAKEIING